MKIILILVALTYVTDGQSCLFDTTLIGNWTSTNYGTMIFSNSTPQLVMGITLQAGSNSEEFDCIFTDGTQYVIRSNRTISILGNTVTVYPFLCLDLRKAGEYSYYFYLNSAPEPLFQNERVKGVQAADLATVTVSGVCDTVIDIAEFHTIVKQGYEIQAAVQCADPLLVSATYTITDATQTYCAGLNTTFLDTCNTNLTNIQFNETMVSDTQCAAQSPMFSTDGNLGCVANIEDTARNRTYVSLYNYDSSLTSGTTFQFTCVALTSDANGTVYMSLRPTSCEAGQSATTIPSDGGRLMELTPLNTCVPTISEESTKDWTWLIVLCVCLFLILVAILIAVLVCLYLKKKERERAKEKKILITEEHPLAEISMPLDAPSSMEPMTETAYLEMREDMFRTPRGKRNEKPMMNPMHESSMVLDFKSPRYSISKGPSMQSIPDDPYSEISNGEIVPISPVGSKTVRSMMNYKQRSFSTAFLEAKPSLLKNGDLVRRSSVGLLTERSFVKSRPPYQRTEIVKSRPASQRNEIPQTPVNERSIRAPSRRPSRVSVRSSEPVVEKAQSVAPSIKSNRTYRSTRTGPAKTADKPKSGRRQNRVHGVVSTKLGRSTTSTQLGSVTQRKTSPKKDRMKRSKTIVDPTLPTIAKAKEGERTDMSAMNELVAAETGSTISETARSKKSVPRRKSILKKKSAYFPVELENDVGITERFPTTRREADNSQKGNDVTDKEIRNISADIALSLSARDSFLGMKAKANSEKEAYTPKPSKSPWH